MKREIWIDWAKAVGIVIVVFCHIPQHESFFRTFCCYLQMPLFFFISGYLHKNQAVFVSSLHKYFRSIVVPYFILQFLNYPYWLFKYITENGQFANWTDCLFEPFLNCLIGNPIAGPTWYICSILLLKLFTDAIYRIPYSDVYIIVAVLLSFVAGFCINHPPLDHQINYTVLSTINFLPFFFCGYFVKRRCTTFNIGKLPGLISLMGCLFLIYLETFVDFPNRLLFYVVGLLSVVAFLYLMQRIPMKSTIIEVVSRGTILILGIHWMFIGTTNFFLEKIFSIQDIYYSAVLSVVLALVFCAIMYLIILFCAKYCKIILGGR